MEEASEDMEEGGGGMEEASGGKNQGRREGGKEEGREGRREGGREGRKDGGREGRRLPIRNMGNRVPGRDCMAKALTTTTEASRNTQTNIALLLYDVK